MLVTRLRQRPLPDRLHRQQRAGADRAATRRAFVTDFRYVEQAADEVDPIVRAPCARAASCSTASPRAARRRRSCGSAFEDAHVSVRDHARLRELLPSGSSWSPAAARSSGCARSRSPTRSSAIRAAARAGRRGARALHRRRAWSDAPSASWRWRSSTRCAERGAQRPRSTRSSPPAPHGALPHAQPRDVAIERRRAGRDRLGRASSTATARTARARSRPAIDRRRGREVYELVLEAQLAGLDAVTPGAGGRDVDAAARARDRRRRPRRAVRPRARPRRRARDPRGAAAVPALRRRCWRRATSSPSSRASTCRAGSASGSRTSSSSPRRLRDPDLGPQGAARSRVG